MAGNDFEELKKKVGLLSGAKKQAAAVEAQAGTAMQAAAFKSGAERQKLLELLEKSRAIEARLKELET